jgi:hypothetical protein
MTGCEVSFTTEATAFRTLDSGHHLLPLCWALVLSSYIIGDIRTLFRDRASDSLHFLISDIATEREDENVLLGICSVASFQPQFGHDM